MRAKLMPVPSTLLSLAGEPGLISKDATTASQEKCHFCIQITVLQEVSQGKDFLLSLHNCQASL